MEHFLTCWIDSRIDRVALIGLTVRSVVQYLTDSEELSAMVELAVVEAVTNAIQHAYNNQEGHPVRVVLEGEEGTKTSCLQITVMDQGKPNEKWGQPIRLEFDEHDYENLPEGGMGLYIISQIMDEIYYYPEFNGWNRFVMKKRFTSMVSETSGGQET